MKWPEPVPGRARTESGEGYRVQKVKTERGTLFAAYEPELTDEQLRRRMKVQYQRGEEPPARRRLIDFFGTPDAAKEACEEHWEHEHDH